MTTSRRIICFLRRLLANYRESQAIQHAGAIAYFGLLAILPLTIIAASILSLLVTGAHVGSPEYSAVDEVLDQIARVVPFIAGEARSTLTALAEAGTGLSLVSACLLMFGASASFTALDRGINAALKTETHRRIMLTKLVFAAGFVAAAGFLFLWQVVKSLFVRWFHASPVALPTWIESSVAEWLLTLLLMAVGFYITLRLVALERHPRHVRLFGALLFGLLFQLAREGLELYLARISVLEELYGAAAAFVGLVLWLYVASLVLLFCCIVIRTIGEQLEPLS